MKKISLIILAISLQSCVSKKVFGELEDKFYEAKTVNDTLLKNNNNLNLKVDSLSSSNKSLGQQLKVEENENNKNQERYKNLKKTYDLLVNQSNEKFKQNAEENQRLLNELTAKQNELHKESERLAHLKDSLSNTANQINELKKLINEKEAAMKALKQTISNALKGFEGNGLTVVQKNGKVYVSMENKLLFNSGSWAVGNNGKKAVKDLAAVLKLNTEVAVQIEGHTDNIPYKGTVIQDNWDLSVKRATAIVRILQNQGVNPEQLTAAGRSQYLPLNPNLNKEGRSKNRRIEIVLSPNLDEINKLLEE